MPGWRLLERRGSWAHSTPTIKAAATTTSRRQRGNIIICFTQEVSRYSFVLGFFTTLTYHARGAVPVSRLEYGTSPGLTVEEWSWLLCDSTGQHAAVGCQGRARCLRAPVLALYLLECGVPAVVLWLKYIILLIVHTGGAARWPTLKVK